MGRAGEGRPREILEAIMLEMNAEQNICSRCERSVLDANGQFIGLKAGMPGAETYLRPGETVICVICIRGTQEAGLGPDPGFFVQRL